MVNILNKVNRNDLQSLIENKGQNKMGPAMNLFKNKITKIETIQDLKELDKIFYSTFVRDTSTKKFSCTSEEIFARKTYSGCSDIGLAISPILREFGIPTIYVESAKVEWIKQVQEDDERKEFMQGHIFLEIYLEDKWYLYDPTNRFLYENYDYNNPFLPKEYIAFAKALNSYDLKVHSVNDEKKISKEILKDFAPSEYKNPYYPKIDLRD